MPQKTVSANMDLCPPRQLGDSDAAAPFNKLPELGSAASLSPGRQRLIERLRRKFCDFQVCARNIQERVAATQTLLNTSIAEEALEAYSLGVTQEMRIARDELRHGRWDVDEEVRAEHDTLCFCLAVWELVHEMAINHSAPSAACLLRWYTTHYLEDEVAEWQQEAQDMTDDPEALEKDSADFWEHLCRIALTDGREQVLRLLRRSSQIADPHVARVCEFLGKAPSLHQMEKARSSDAEFRQAEQEIQSEASKILQRIPQQHPVRRLLEIYAGCPQGAFEAGEDVAKKWSRTWTEDFIFAHAWVCPDFRRTELGDLLKAIARRRTEETIDDVDRVLFAVITLDIPTLLELLGSMPERFPVFFVTHLVDIFYFAGRVPLKVDVKGSRVIPPRDWHLMSYARELCAGPRALQHCAIDYLRAGGSQEATRFLELVADRYCTTASAERELEEALGLLGDLDMQAKLGLQHCRWYAQKCRSSGDIAGCLRWACHAETCCKEPRGYYVSELLDALAAEDLSGLLDAISPSDLTEALEQYPPAHLLALLRMPSDDAAAGAGCRAPSGRLYFYVQYARCRAVRLAGKPASAYTPTLVRMLVTGAAPPGLARVIIEDELVPALKDASPPLSTDEALKLMRYVQTISSDHLRRIRLTMDNEELHQAMAGCLSRAILQGPPSSSLDSCRAASGRPTSGPSGYPTLTGGLFA